MYKLNNKGFAFSTLLYGLLIMGMMIVFLIMGVLQTNRANNKYFVEKIEEELNRFSLTETEFVIGSDESDGQEYIVPMGQSGWYKIELWGAQGGGNDVNNGLGSYTSGMIYLEENTHLYFYIGKSVNGNTGNMVFNGGGSSSNGNPGGGATDVRLISGSWDNTNSLNSRIMVAAGGGGKGGSSAGGAGGTVLGIKGAGSSGGAAANQADSNIGKGVNATASNAGSGGGGYYGGSAGGANSGGGSGTSYISGYAGCASVCRTLKSQEAVLYNDASGTWKFYNGTMISNVRVGNGTAKIQKINDNDASKLPDVYNSKISSGVRYVKDCISGARVNNSDTISKNVWKEIQVISNGKNVAWNKSVKIGSDEKKDIITDGVISYTSDKAEGSNTTQCAVLDLGQEYNNISEIAIWHDFTQSNYAVKNHTLEVKGASGEYKHIITSNNAEELESYATENGYHYTPWNPDSTAQPRVGTYYIQSANSNNFFITMNGTEAKKLRFTGDNNQKWTLKSTDDGYFQILSASDGKSLQIINGTADNMSSVGVDDYYGLDYQKWKFVPAGEGTYYLVSKLDTYLGTNDVGYNDSGIIVSRRLVESSATGTNSEINRRIRFKLIATNY